MSVNLTRPSAIAVCILGTLLQPGAVGGHLRDAVFPVYELPSSVLPDVHDGTLADWETVLAPSVQHSHLIAYHLGESQTRVPTPTAEITDESFDWDRWLEDMSVRPRQPSYGHYNVAGTHWPSADHFVDGLLIPCDVEDCSESPGSAVRPDSWGRIKARFR